MIDDREASIAKAMSEAVFVKTEKKKEWTAAFTVTIGEYERRGWLVCATKKSCILRLLDAVEKVYNELEKEIPTPPKKKKKHKKKKEQTKPSEHVVFEGLDALGALDALDALDFSYSTTSTDSFAPVESNFTQIKVDFEETKKFIKKLKEDT